MMTGLAVIALAAGILLATGAISFAQTGEPTPTPSPSEDSGDDGTPTPAPSDEDTDTGTEDDANDTEDDADSGGDDAEGTEDDDAERRGCGGGKYLVKEAAAEVLGLSEDELRAALRDGQSLAQMAEAQGMSVEDFTAALQSNITAALQAQLDAGEITQEEFDEVTANLSENLTDIINAEGGFRSHRGFDGGGEEEGTEGTGTRFRAPFQRSPAGSGT
jgi:hypothetical protein